MVGAVARAAESAWSRVWGTSLLVFVRLEAEVRVVVATLAVSCRMALGRFEVGKVAASLVVVGTLPRDGRTAEMVAVGCRPVAADGTSTDRGVPHSPGELL